jgi:hypothetical protein
MMTAKEHNRLVGILLMAHGGLQGVVAILLSVVYGIIGVGMFLAGQKADEKTFGAVFLVLTVGIVIVAAMIVVPQVYGSFKMLKEKPNARTWGIVGSIVSCLSFPLGTAAGAYGLWFLFGDEGKGFYMGGINQLVVTGSPLPPPPNSWQ